MKLTAKPLEKPRHSIAVIGVGFLLHGKRVGDEVVVQVSKTKYCATRVEQKARGFKVIERKAVGYGLTMEWLSGAVLTAAGVLLFTNSFDEGAALRDGEVALEQTKSMRVYGSGLALAGTALLAGAIWQTSQLGREQIDLGVKTLKRDGLAKPCRQQKAHAGKVRLTLDGGLQLVATVDATGYARIKLPDDLEKRLKEGGPRATLEVLGDWRSQRRLDLSREGAQTLP